MAVLVLVQGRDNARFDPDTFVPTECAIPPYQTAEEPETFFQPTEGVCGIDGDEGVSVLDSISDMDALAQQYAPVIFFHPLEPYTLANVPDTFDDPLAGSIQLNGDFVTQYDDELQMESLFNSSRGLVTGMNGHEYFFQHNLTDDYKSGAGYDEQGRSRASIHYNVFDSGNGTVTFNYYLYYAYNGEANMAVLSSVNNTVQYVPFHLPPFGIHEGDWEAVSVIVCAPNAADADAFNNTEDDVVQEPLAVSYRQHGWNQITDCTKGECNFYKDTMNPVGFAALHSHATYPVSTENLIYTTVTIPFFANLQGFFVVDRTTFKDAEGAYRYFSPNAGNVLQLRDPESLTATDADAWQAFAGGWGDRIPIRREPGPPACLNLEQTAFVDCPTAEENPVFQFAMEVMGVYNSTRNGGLLKQLTDITGEVGRIFSKTSVSPRGPVTKNFYATWLPPVTNTFYLKWPANTTETEFCEQIKTIPDTSRLPVEVKAIDSKGNISGMIALLVVLTLANFLALLYIANIQRSGQSLLHFDDSGVVQRPEWRKIKRIYAPAIFYSIAYGVTLTGGIFFVTNVAVIFETWEERLNGLDWHAAKVLIVTLGVVVICIDTALLFVNWLSSHELWCSVRLKYCDLVKDKKTRDIYESYIWWNTTVVRWTFTSFFALLFLSLMLSILCVLVGVSAVGLSVASESVCRDTVGSTDDAICIDMKVFGLDDIKCGSDFVQFCNTFSGGSELRALWGALWIAVGHFYLISATAAAAYQQDSERFALESYTIADGCNVLAGQSCDSFGSDSKKQQTSSELHDTPTGGEG